MTTTHHFCWLTCICIQSVLLLSTVQCRRYEKCSTHGGRQGVCVAKRYCRETSVGTLQSCDGGDTYCCPLPTTTKPSFSAPENTPASIPEPREEPPNIPRHRDEPPNISRHRDEPPNNPRHRDEPPNNPRHRDEPPNNPRHRDEPPNNPRHRDEPPNNPRGRDEPPSIYRPRDEPQNVPRSRDDPPNTYRPRDEPPNNPRDRDDPPNTYRPRDEPPIIYRPSEEEPTISRPREESSRIPGPREEQPQKEFRRPEVSDGQDRRHHPPPDRPEEDGRPKTQDSRTKDLDLIGGRRTSHGEPRNKARDESEHRNIFKDEDIPERPSYRPPSKWNDDERIDHAPSLPKYKPVIDKTPESGYEDSIKFPGSYETSIHQPKVPDCGVKPYDLFIAGGEESEEHEWPWMTAIFRRHQGSKPKTFLCGGSLINTRYVLTAAHCFVHNYVILPASSFVVRLGSHFLDSGEEYTVSYLAVHNNHSGSDFFNDIALARLASEVYVTDKIAPICLPSVPHMLFEDLVDRMATVAGWGDTAFRTSGTRILQDVEVPIVSSEDCFSAYSRVKGAAFLAKGSDHVVCAGLREGGKDACLGDSGGPLMMKTEDDRWVVIGIVSLGYKCAEPGYPGVYTRVTHYMSWIQSKIKSRW